MSDAAPNRPTSDVIGPGRVAVVTGGASGIGLALCQALASEGSSVVVADLDGVEAEAVAARLRAGGAVAVATAVDVADPASVDALAASLVDREISIVINNAGIAGPVAPLTEIDVDAWDEVFDINVRGVFLICKAFLPAMVDRGQGDVINLASVSGKRPLVRRTPYCASKMAVIGLTSTLAFEVGPTGVNVNSLSPGPVDGPRMDRNFRLEAERSGRTYDEAVDTFVSRAALGRMVTETEVGAAVLAMLAMPGLCGADIDLSAGMVA